tara:strand:- start:465 stop:722 length:258 start_codon:yes stop_codon:yes gene_type:complete
MALTSASASRAGNGLGSHTEVVSGSPADQAGLDALVAALGARGNTVAGIDGAHGGTMHFALQGGPAAGGETIATVALTAVATFEE